MRYYPNIKDEWDRDELKRLNAATWQLDLLKMNPPYCGWGPHEDYMIVKGEGWNSPKTFASWKAFGPWGLDDLNEVANFYFTVERDSKQCETCGGNGYHPDGQWITESFYRHSSPFTHQTEREMQARAIMESFGSSSNDLHGRGNYPSAETLAKYGPAFKEFCEEMRVLGSWGDRITDDEQKALKDAGRSGDGPMGHDAINRGILVKARCERLGVPTTCDTCDGHGTVFTAEAAHVNVVLWVLHPRKGCSRGIEVRLAQDDVPAVFDYLTAAAKRNADRFSGLRKAKALPHD